MLSLERNEARRICRNGEIEGLASAISRSNRNSSGWDPLSGATSRLSIAYFSQNDDIQAQFATEVSALT